MKAGGTPAATPAGADPDGAIVKLANEFKNIYNESKNDIKIFGREGRDLKYMEAYALLHYIFIHKCRVHSKDKFNSNYIRHFITTGLQEVQNWIDSKGQGYDFFPTVEIKGAPDEEILTAKRATDRAPPRGNRHAGVPEGVKGGAGVLAETAKFVLALGWTQEASTSLAIVGSVAAGTAAGAAALIAVSGGVALIPALIGIGVAIRTQLASSWVPNDIYLRNPEITVAETIVKELRTIGGSTIRRLEPELRTFIDAGDNERIKSHGEIPAYANGRSTKDYRLLRAITEWYTNSLYGLPNDTEEIRKKKKDTLTKIRTAPGELVEGNTMPDHTGKEGKDHVLKILRYILAIMTTRVYAHYNSYSEIPMHGESIKKNTAEIDSHKTEIDSNKTGITSNKTGIDSHKTEIDSNKTGITSNKTGIDSHKTEIDSNKTGITSNKTGITSNKTGITSNKTGITSNKTGITSNKTGIDSNTAGITSNTQEVEQSKVISTRLGEKLDTIQAMFGKLEQEIKQKLSPPVIRPVSPDLEL
jgi:hypothetical protein